MRIDYNCQEFEGVNEQGHTLDEIHNAFLVLKENIQEKENKKLLKESLNKYETFNIF